MAIDFKKYIMSTGKHYIANSGHDENNKYHGGVADALVQPVICHTYT